MNTQMGKNHCSLTQVNRDFYNHLWQGVELHQAEAFNTWPAISPYFEQCKDRLEIGPGLRPRLPVEGTQFVDLSPVAVSRLNDAGGQAVVGSIESLSAEDESMDLVCAFDVLEHIEDDRMALGEITRVLRKGGVLFLSVPLYQSAWTGFDQLVGHARRYEPDALEALLHAHGITVRRSAAYGMQLESRMITRVGLWFLKYFSRMALSWYNKFVFPRQLKKQQPLIFQPGIIQDPQVDEVVMECVKRVDAANEG